MMITVRDKKQIEDAYKTFLAPYATVFPREDSRVHAEDERLEENRSSFQRDRDRIIHSKAFRRLMYKTQVFVNHEGDHYRTRLTHSLEVAQFAKGICKSLGLNEDLAEAIALGHDLGHTPFGHAVEEYLNKELQNRGLGEFYHNEQSVRIVEELELRCKEYVGLNLTWEVREGILKHNRDRSDGKYDELMPNQVCSTLEGQIVGLVDTIAYICHDIQDGIQSGLIERVMEENNDFKKNIQKIIDLITSILEEDEEITFRQYSDTFFIDHLIHRLIMSITKQSIRNLNHYQVKCLEDVHTLAEENIELISMEAEVKEKFKTLKGLVYDYVYGIHTIQTMDAKAVRVVKDLFELFIDNEALLPPKEFYRYKQAQEANKDTGIQHEIIVICDYIACLTDRSALEEHERLTNPHIKI